MSFFHPDDPFKPAPPGMTEEQLDYFSYQTQRAVRRGLRWYRNGALMAFVVLAIGTAGGYLANNSDNEAARNALTSSGRAVAVDSCNRDFETFDKIFRRLIAATEAAHAAGRSTQAERDVAVNFYQDELHHLPDCRKAKALLTDNPNDPIKVPTPRFRGDGR